MVSAVRIVIESWVIREVTVLSNVDWDGDVVPERAVDVVLPPVHTNILVQLGKDSIYHALISNKTHLLLIAITQDHTIRPAGLAISVHALDPTLSVLLLGNTSLVEQTLVVVRASVDPTHGIIYLVALVHVDLIVDLMDHNV